jgi:DNA-binding HxlR family transcriptional regulator
MVSAMKPLEAAAGPTCSDVEDVAPNFSAKWTVRIIALLTDGARRFSDLKRQLEPITQKSLTFALRELERDGMVVRTVTPVIPPRVDYELTPLGRSAVAPLQALGAWAHENRETVRAARQRFGEIR